MARAAEAAFARIEDVRGGHPMDFDLIVRNATLPDGRKRQDLAVAAGRIAAIEPHIGAQAKQTIERRRLSSVAAVRRLPLPHGCDAVARPAPAERLRHLAGGDRAVGRTQASTDAGSRRRARAALLRSRRVAGPSRRAQPCRRLRRSPARGRGPARCEEAGEALSRPAAGRLSRRTAISARRPRRGISSGRSISASTSSAAFRISNARWRRARRR